MNEESLNMQIRKFLKKVGINSQREIENALREAEAAGRLNTGDTVALGMTLKVDSLGVSFAVEDTLRIE